MPKNECAMGTGKANGYPNIFLGNFPYEEILYDPAYRTADILTKRAVSSLIRLRAFRMNGRKELPECFMQSGASLPGTG